jgi:hypothetical protein
VNYDEETLMAYADGELEAPLRAQIDAAVAADPALAARVAAHRALRAEVTGAFAGVLTQPVPDRLREAASGAVTRARGNVVQFPARGSRAPAVPWRAREWFAVAASLVIGIMISWRYFEAAQSSSTQGGLIAANGGAMVARGVLATALDAQLASNQATDSAVLIGLTFHARDGSYCRSFSLRDGGTTGLACRSGGEWRIPVTATADAAGGDFRQAAGTIPPAVMQAIEARMAGEALAADGETQARDAGWKTLK